MQGLNEQIPCVSIKSLVIQEQCKLIFCINQNMLKSQVITKKNKEKTNYRMRRPNDFAITSKVKSERAKKVQNMHHRKHLTSFQNI